LNEVKTIYLSFIADPNGPASIAHAVSYLEKHLSVFAPNIRLDVASYTQNILTWALAHLDMFFSGFFTIFVGAILTVLALFFMLRDASALQEKIFLLSPLKKDYDENIIKRIRNSINSVIKGAIVTSVIQGLYASVGFWISGIPNPVVFGLLAMILSLIPGIGTSIVAIPAIIYLFVIGAAWKGAFLIVWYAIGVVVIDNIISPHLLKRGIKIHPFVLLISVLGGIALFGPIGFIVGPVILAFFSALLDMYPIITADQQ
jgi:predicted PurR-regulated permease PerM